MGRTLRQLPVITAAADVVDAELVDDETAGASVVVHADRDRHLSPETVAAIRASVADSTRRAYGTDRNAFAAWCLQEGRTAVPASAETMAEWARHLTVTARPRTNRPAGPSTIECAMSAVTSWHEEQGRPKSNMRGARPSSTRTRIGLPWRRLRPRRRGRRPRLSRRGSAPCSPGVERSTLAGKRSAALVLLGFATAARVSEEERQTIVMGDGEFGAVTRQVWDYKVGGHNIIKSWFDYRKKEPGGRRSSPLDDVNATTWDSDWTGEFLDLLSVLTRLTGLEPEQAEILESILTGGIATLDDLAAEGGRWPQCKADRKPRFSLDSAPVGASDTLHKRLVRKAGSARRYIVKGAELLPRRE
ncbi:type ISP restriction/modification enzyme [Streptomyces sp. NPDC100445]|uniref:type ISP restriction/modification enzyme n=1 Tax=Streptomyces sp. NPDC100445 TaxID=3366102 RepID=UPI0037FBCC30